MNGTAEIAGEGEGLKRELVGRAAVVLDEDEHAHPATPISRMISTTRGAASGPVPSTSACLPWPGGTTRRSFSSFAAGRSGVRCSTGFERARSLAGTDG